MKKVSTLIATLLIAAGMQAQQTVDTSTWQPGDDVSDAVGFGNRSFENNPMDYWQRANNGGNVTTTGGLFEIYNGSNCDVYQYLYLPAGMYNLECQGYYRNGNSWSSDPSSFSDGSWVNRGQLYVEEGLYDIDSNEFTQSGSVFEGWLMPRLFDIQAEQLYAMPEEDNPGWDMSDAWYENNGTWGPQSIPGSLIWFANGKYMPYDDGAETQYNTITFFVTEDTWVKLGVKKTEAKDADSFMVTNFRLVYQGDAGEQAQIQLALKALYVAQEKADALAESIYDEFPGLGSLCQDILMEYEYDSGDVESIKAATEAYRNMLADFNNALRDLRSLINLITTAENLVATTDYSGKSDFLAAIEAARKIAEDGNDGNGSSLEDFSAYSIAKAELGDAQVTYILTQEVTDGFSDYSYAIYKPFFVDDAYNPTWDEEAGVYKFSDEIEDTWMTIQEKDYTSAKGDHSDWIPIVDEFPVTADETAENRWVIHQTTWHGGGLGDVTLQHGYPAIGGWTAEPSGNPELLYQTITGLPNGFYSMSALMCNAGADISPLMYVYIENSEGARETAPLTQKGNPWWGGNRDQWRQTVWEKLTTGMVQVTDGRVTIGASSDFFYAVTGFQLYYYGENPDFSSMIQKKIAEVQSNAINKLTFPGDIKHVDQLLSQVILPVEGFDAYDAANKALNEAAEYIETSYNYLNSWSLLDQVINDESNVADNDPVYDVYEHFAFDQVINIGVGDDDTYLTAQAASATYNNLKSYLAFRQTVADAGTSDELTEMIARHNTQLSHEEITDELIEALRAELEDVYNNIVVNKNAQIFAELGADQATSANPVEITAILVNPTFDNGSTGWTGGITVDGNLHNAERFNTTFDFYQTIASLPAGVYVAKVQAFYRETGVGSPTGGAYFNWWYGAAGDIEYWEGNNVEFYAKTDYTENVSYITSIASEKYTDRSLERIMNAIDDSNAEQLLDENGAPVYDENGKEVWVNIDTLWYRYDDEAPNWQFDVSVKDEDAATGDSLTYFYPNSMAGTAARFAKNPESYQNEVRIDVYNGQDLTIGMRKSVSVDNDWCIFDNFRLFYLGTDQLPELPDGIEIISGGKTETKAIYNLNGQMLAAPQRGLNIINGNKVLVK